MNFVYVAGLICIIFICCIYASLRYDLGEGFESIQMRNADKLKQIIANINTTGYMPRQNNTKYNGIVSRIIKRPFGNDLGYYVVAYDANKTSEFYVASNRFPSDASNIQVGRNYDISQNYVMPILIDTTTLTVDDTKQEEMVKTVNILRCIPEYDQKTRNFQSRTMNKEYLDAIDPILQIIGMDASGGAIGTDVSGIAKNLWRMKITPEEAIFELAKKYKTKMNAWSQGVAGGRHPPVFDKYKIYPSLQKIYDLSLNDISSNYFYDKLWNTLDVSGVSAELLKTYKPTEFTANEGEYDESKFPEYHESPEELKKKNLPVYVKDANGKLVAMPWDDATKTTPFYDMRRKTSNYVPDYPESRYLSKFSLA
jgi:hypothetical protein